MWLIESLLRARGRAVRPGLLSVVGVMAIRGHQSPPVTAPEPRHSADSPACSLQRCVDRLVPRRVVALQWWRQAQRPDRGDTSQRTSQPQWWSDALRTTRSIPPPVMLFLRCAYLVGGRTPHRVLLWLKHWLLVQCRRSWLLSRAHPSRRPLLSEPCHHRSSRRAVRAARAGRPQPPSRPGRSAPGC